MISNKIELKKCLKYEKTHYGNIPKFYRILAFLQASEIAIIWKYQVLLRKWEFHLNRRHKLRATISQYKTCKLGRKFGLHMSPNCFDVGLRIVHLGPILVNSNTRVGKNCTIHVNTCIVATGGVSAAPHIGDNCKIGVGATLIGNIIIGNQVAVGAGSVVTKSFDEDHITLAGVPAKIISYKALM